MFSIFRFLLVLFVLLISASSYAANDLEKGKIRMQLYNDSDDRTLSVGYIDSKNITRYISHLKSELCRYDKGITYEVWLSADINGTIFTSQSGIKVIIDCSK